MLFDLKKFKCSLIRTDCSLFENYAFKTVFHIFSILFLATFLFSLYISIQMDFSLTYEGMNNLVFNVFRVPFSIAVVFFTLTTFFGLHLRSYQTQKQISVTMEKNNFDNYYKHRDEFKKHLYSIFKEDQVLVYRIYSVHKMLFPDSKRGIYNINSEYCINTINDLSMHANLIIGTIESMQQLIKDDSTNSKEFLKLANYLLSLTSKLHLYCEEIGISFEKLFSGFYDGSCRQENNSMNFEYYRYLPIFCSSLIMLVESIFSFDENYIHTEK